MILSARPVRVFGWAVVVPALLLLAAPAAFLGVLQFWKREVRFGEDGWRYRTHIQGTALARFPLVEPVAAPRFTQRITSGWGTYLDVAYRTRAPARTVLEQVARNCPDEAWAREGAPPPAPEGIGPAAFLPCGPVLFTVTRAGDGLAVSAFLTD